MTISELIEALEEARDVAFPHDDVAVNVAFQPSYPLAASIAAISVVDGQLWLAVNDSGSYAPGDAWSGEIENPDFS
jgi:hypothetical protein